MTGGNPDKERAAQDRAVILADRLAAALANEDGVRAFRLAAHLKQSAVTARSHDESPPNFERIGIWRRVCKNDRTFYERGNFEPWWIWADVNRIEPKQADTSRIVFIGESVARANEYAPNYSPAGVLQSVLRSSGLPRSEVIDLARVGMGAGQLIEIARGAVALEPDAMVIFAGNNWLQWSADETHATAISLLNTTDAAASESAKCSAELELAGITREVVRALGAITRDAGIPIVFLIPEFNLADWQTAGPDLPLLERSEIDEWCQHRRTAQAACKAEDYVAAEAAARRMLMLDRGTMAITFELLYASSVTKPDHERRQLKERARDAGLGMLREFWSRCNAVTQSTLRTELPLQGIDFIDLPQRLAVHLDGALPGRNLFLDHVHMNATGIRVCMAMAAEWLHDRLGADSRPTFRTLLDAAPEPAPEAAAFAMLHAAYVSWAWGQSHELQRYYCRTALEMHPSTLAILQDWIAYKAGAAPDKATRLRRSHRSLRERIGPAARYTLDPFNDDKYSALGFLENATAELETRYAGANARLRALLERGYTLGAEGSNLLEPHFRAEPALIFFGGRVLDEGHPRTYYRSFAPESSFFFVSGSESDVSLTITWRMPEQTSDGASVAIHLNRCHHVEIPSSREWSTCTVSLPRSSIVAGVNHLDIHWPVPNAAWRERLERMVHDMDMGRTGYGYPAYGDLATLRAVPG